MANDLLAAGGREEPMKAVVVVALFAMAILSTAFAPTTASAIVLTFTDDGTVCTPSPCAAGSFITQGHGSTPAVSVIYLDQHSGGLPLRWWPTDYNNLHGVLYAGVGGDSFSHARIELRPLLGNTVTLNSFDLGAWFHAVRGTSVQILDALTNVVLLNFGAQTIGTGDVATHFTVGITSANGLAIEWSNSAFNVGIDNIDFTLSGGAEVPEPGTVVLLGTGLTAVAWMSWRRRRRRPTA